MSPWAWTRGQAGSWCLVISLSVWQGLRFWEGVGLGGKGRRCHLQEHKARAATTSG